MCQSQYEGIIEVQSFWRTIGGEDVVNDLLRKGNWVLLEVKILQGADGEASVVYVVGRKEEKEE